MQGPGQRRVWRPRGSGGTSSLLPGWGCAESCFLEEERSVGPGPQASMWLPGQETATRGAWPVPCGYNVSSVGELGSSQDPSRVQRGLHQARLGRRAAWGGLP